MKIYLDIDGVLLGNNDGGHGLACGAGEFIDYVTNHFDCYWLTTHCKGDAGPVLKYLRKHVEDEIYEQLGLIRPTDFEIFKTEALNPEDEFIWIDDQPLGTELDWLENQSKLSSWWETDTYTNPRALEECLSRLKELPNR